MKLSIDRATLVKALAHVQSIVEKRNTIPILANVLLQADGDNLSLSATDMDLQVVESISAKVSQGGATTTPAHTLYDIVRKLPDGVMIDLAGGNNASMLTLTAGRSNFKLGCLPVADFPQLSGDDLAMRFTLSPTELKGLIDRAKFAMSTEETRYYLNGMYMHAATGSFLRTVATDGHRLARIEMSLPDGASEIPGVIIPRKTVTELRKLLDENASSVEVAVSAAKIQFKFGNVRLTSKLIDGTYPDYERVIPAANENMLEVLTKDLAAAVDRVSTVATDKTRTIKMTIDGATMTLSAQSPESGSAVEEVEIQYAGPPIEIGFNARYLQDITSQIDGETCTIRLADGSQPAIIRDKDNENSLFVLMPMRVMG